MLQFLREEKAYNVANLNVTDIFTSEYDLYHTQYISPLDCAHIERALVL